MIIHLSLWQASSSLSPNNLIGSPLSLSRRITFWKQKQETSLQVYFCKKKVLCHFLIDSIHYLSNKQTSSLGIIADFASPPSFFFLNLENTFSSSAALFPNFSWRMKRVMHKISFLEKEINIDLICSKNNYVSRAEEKYSSYIQELFFILHFEQSPKLLILEIKLPLSKHDFTYFRSGRVDMYNNYCGWFKT